jgi:hypothetical protein
LHNNSQIFVGITQHFIERGAKVAIRTFFEIVKMGNQLGCPENGDFSRSWIKTPHAWIFGMKVLLDFQALTIGTPVRFSDPDSQK